MKGKSHLAAAIAVSLACGYIAGKAGGRSDAEAGAIPSSSVRPDRPSSREARSRATGESELLDSILGGRAIGEIPPADLAELISRLAKYEPGMDPLVAARQRYQLQLLLAKLSPSKLSEIATAIQDDPDAKKSNSLNFILAALAQKDSSRALGWLSNHEFNPSVFSTVVGVIARDDPQAAADLLRDAVINGNIASNQLWSASYQIGQAMAKLGALPLLTYLDTLPKQQQSNIISNNFQNLPEGERIKFLDEILRRSEDGSLSEFRVENIFPNFLASNQAAATEWFSRLPDGPEKNSIRINAVNQLFERGEKEVAAKWMRDALAATPGKEKEALGSVIQNMVFNNPEGIKYFAELLPEGAAFTSKDFENYAENSLYNGTGGLTALTSAIPDPDEKARLLASTLGKISPSTGLSQRFNSTDYEILSRQIAAMGFTGENATLVNDALAAARKFMDP